MLKSSNKVRPNSLCKPLIGQTFHRVDHDSWSKHCNLHWIHFITAIVKLCGCHPHPNFTFSLGGFLCNQIWCYVCECLHDLDVCSLHVILVYLLNVWNGCMVKVLWVQVWTTDSPPLSEVYLSYCNSNNWYHSFVL